MNDSFEKSFTFTEITAAPGRHTDASDGTRVNFLAMMLEGTSRIVCPTHEINMAAGDVFFIPLGCRYHSYWYGDKKVRWISIGFTHFPGCDNNYILQKITADDTVREVMHYLSRYKTADCHSIGKFYTLLGELIGTMEKETPSKHRVLIDSAISYMNATPTASMREVAKHCRVSESGLYAAFRECGTTPALSRQKQQIEHAVTLITTTDLTTDEIAERSGFNSTAYFLRVLKKLTGKTTREIRRGVNI